MKRQWDIEELIEHFTLIKEDEDFLANKVGATRLGCALLLKYFQYEGRFPNAKYEIPKAVVDYVARQLKLDADLFAQYDWDGRTIKLHPTQDWEHLNFREAAAEDSERMSSWLVATHLATDHNPDHLKAKVLARFREERIEPPTIDRIERLIRSACMTYEQTLFQTVFQRLSPETGAQLDHLLERSEQVEAQEESDDDAPSARAVSRREVITWRDLKTSPGAVGLESILYEIDKLRVLSQLVLPPDVFGEASSAVIGLYRQRAATETLYELRRYPDATRYILLAAFCMQRCAEITDNLIELLLRIVHRIGARAEKRINKELLDELRGVANKPRLLYQVAEAALAHPDETIRVDIFRVLSEEQCKAIVQEYKTKGSYQQQVHLCMRSSYRDHYRRMVPPLVNMLEVRSSNSVHQPVVRELELIKRYIGTPGIWYPVEEDVPLDGVVRPMWEAVVIEKDKEGEQRVNRVNYELCVLEVLREGLRCRELWVAGANKYRNPDDDLPKDFDERREEYYQALDQLKEAQAFVDTHGQNEVAFGFCHLLGFQLMPRLKNIYAQRLARPETGKPDAYPNLQPILAKPIDWDLIREQYDQMIKYATALRLGTAETESILRRFTQKGLTHPTYRAFAALGRAVKTIFLCRYLQSEELRREIHEGLNVIENWSGANSFIFYGRGGDFATNRLDEQELAALSLHLLQICLVYINTLLIQQVLAEPKQFQQMKKEDLRALTPLIYSHVTPYGTFRLDLSERMLIEEAIPA